jgi:hypothetical protein|tara:strand:+ start:249 stop:665 length:417 start_codon:yes stop_codon:yes gene_type:complete
MKRMDISDNTAISMPIRNMIAIIGAVCIGVWAYFGITEKLNQHDTQLTLIQKDLETVVEFSIKYPRGELGQSQNDLEQFMLIEELYKIVDRIQKEVDENADNKINIDFLKEQMEKAQMNIEKLKDADREITYKNGNGH